MVILLIYWEENEKGGNGTGQIYRYLGRVLGKICLKKSPIPFYSKKVSALLLFLKKKCKKGAVRPLFYLLSSRYKGSQIPPMNFEPTFAIPNFERGAKTRRLGNNAIGKNALFFDPAHLKNVG